MELKHEGMIWPEPWSPEHLWGRESGHVKVGFVVEKSHVSKIFKMKNFDELRSLRALVYKFSALPGAAR